MSAAVIDPSPTEATLILGLGILAVVALLARWTIKVGEADAYKFTGAIIGVLLGLLGAGGIGALFVGQAAETAAEAAVEQGAPRAAEEAAQEVADRVSEEIERALEEGP